MCFLLKILPLFIFGGHFFRPSLICMLHAREISRSFKFGKKERKAKNRCDWHIRTLLRQEIDRRAIYANIVSYKDMQCRHTIESIFNRARFPDRIRVGVVDQIEFDKDLSCDMPTQPCKENSNQMVCEYRNRIDVYELDSTLAVGLFFARHVA